MYKTVISLLQYFHHPLCLCCLLFWRPLSFYLFHYCYVCTSFRLILYFISKTFNLQINVALQLTKLWLKKVTKVTTIFAVEWADRWRRAERRRWICRRRVTWRSWRWTRTEWTGRCRRTGWRGTEWQTVALWIGSDRSRSRPSGLWDESCSIDSCHRRRRHRTVSWRDSRYTA